jgi:acyl carrier protein
VLVAYLVAQAGPIEQGRTARAAARALPDFMVPSHFVVVSPPAAHAQPQGRPQGAAGARHGCRRARRGRGLRGADRGPIEETIASIWKDVLKLPQVGTRDNFFDLGGHSLLAVQTHRRLKEVLQRDLSITDIFRFPTIQSLSAYLGNEGEDDAAAQSGKARAQGRRAAMQRRRATADADEQG